MPDAVFVSSRSDPAHTDASLYQLTLRWLVLAVADVVLSAFAKAVSGK